jgi:DNA polymerase V
MNTAAKNLGVPQFEPYFKMKNELHKLGVHVFSSNYELYGDLSARIMDTLSTFAADIHVYSIDEAFLDLRGHVFDKREWAHNVIHCIQKNIGMPVRVGIGKTKTLTKVANVVAKKVARAKGVCCIDSESQREKILKKFPLSEVWGIGRKLNMRLGAEGIVNAWQLAEFDKTYLRKTFSVVVERTALELQGIECIPFHDEPEAKKQIVVSRSFSLPITEVKPLQAVTADYLSKAMMKLRQNNLLVETLIVSASSSRFSDGYVSHHKVIKLPTPSNDTLAISIKVTEAIAEMFRPNNKYVRSMVCLSELRDEGFYQRDLLANEQSDKSMKLMAVIDQLNKHNNNQVFIGSAGIKNSWAMARRMKSPNYTTCWPELPKVKC